MAQASDDLSLPFVFESPGGEPPVRRGDGLAGERQWPAYTTLLSCRIQMPEPGRTRQLLAGFEKISVDSGAENRMEFRLQGRAGHADKTIVWIF